MRVAELKGAKLDYWVAQAQGDDFIKLRDKMWFRPSSNWEQGGPIVAREHISLWKYDGEYGLPKDIWFAAIGGVHGWDDGSVVGAREHKGATPLIAAMRAYVASKFGDEVQDIQSESAGSSSAP